ncbi:MAG: aryl-sulfate sulfotransferase [Planctomycetota bacterium]|nr:aryl-sulfate sulfotransferase [Planctomycetota bacterium]
MLMLHRFSLSIAITISTLMASTVHAGNCPGDIDSSGAVDGSDLATLLSGWGTTDPTADIDGSGAIDGADLTLMLGAWGACPLPPEEWTLVTSTNNTTTTAYDSAGQVARTWTGATGGASIGYLAPDGSLVRPSIHTAGAYNSAARGGRIQIWNAAGTLTNDLLVSTAAFQQHHDIRRMPNGHILCIAWEGHTQAEGTAAGRVGLTGPIWPETILEIEPTGYSTYNIVWRWSLWNHLIQDVNPSLPSYGVIAEHPELVNINFGTIAAGSGDWNHANCIDYNAARDEIVLSSRTFNEVWVIDHSTTTAQAATHLGGNRNRGGDLLYRWGNPNAYGRGTVADKVFFTVHSAHWIPAGLPGAGNILAFNNGDRTGTANDYSTVVELVPPRDPNGAYVISSSNPFGPTSPVWSHGVAGAFYGGPTQCGAFRTRDNTTMITLTNSGVVFEVNASGQTVWTRTFAGSIPRVPRYWMENGLWVGP